MKTKERLYTVREIAEIYNSSRKVIATRAKRLGFRKKVSNGSLKYLLSAEQVNEIFRIPNVSENVIYCHTIWEILPSKLNFLTLKHLQTKFN